MKTLLLFVLLLGSYITLSNGVYAAEGSSSLSWVAPETREDGTPLASTEIAEFRIYHTISLEPTVPILGQDYTVVTGENEATITLQLTPNPKPYVVSFAITTVDLAGAESRLSEPVSKEFLIKSTADPEPPNSITLSFTCVDGCTITEL
jgi:hypothetical protein